MIKSNVRSYELVKAINDSSLTHVATNNTSTEAGIYTGFLTSAATGTTETKLSNDGTTSLAYLSKTEILNAAVKYTTTRLWVYLDEEGRIKFYQDFIRDIQDLVYISLEKTLSETVESAEFNFFDLLKNIEDAIIVSDQLEPLIDKLVLDTFDAIDESILDLDKSISDSVLYSELIEQDFAKSLETDQLALDYAYVSFAKQVSDTQEQSDSVDLSPTKALSDFQNQTDVFSRIAEFDRDFSDFVNALDTISGIVFYDEEADSVAFDPIGLDDDPAFGLDKAPIDEVIAASDLNTVNPQKSLDDTENVIDELALEPIKNLEDLPLLTDSSIIDISKSLDDYVHEYDAVEVLIEWNRLFEEAIDQTDLYSSLFEKETQIELVEPVDDFSRDVQYDREFDDLLNVSDQISSVNFNDEESDSVVVEPIGAEDDPAFNLDKAPIYELVDNADLSIIGFDKVSEESQGQADSISSFGIDKALVDAQNLDDTTSLAFETLFTDLYSASDVFVKLSEFYRDFSESVNNSEELKFGLSKALAEIAESLDSSLIDFDKPDLTDVYSVNDNFSKNVEFLRDFLDNVSPSDSVSGIAFYDEEADSVAFEPIYTDDDPEILIGKGILDVSTISDNASNEPILTKAETQNQADSISNIDIVKLIQEVQSQVDAYLIDIIKNGLIESVSSIDVFDRTSAYDRAYSETQSQSDSNYYSFSRGTTSETVTNTDSRIIQPYKYLYETASETDSGTLLNTDYAGSYYFGDDFVGSKRTF